MKDTGVTGMLDAGKDDIFGEDVKKSYFDESRQAGKSVYTVSTISYCDLHKITMDDLQTIMDAYPEFAGDFILNFGVTFNLREVRIAVICSVYFVSVDDMISRALTHTF